MEGRPSGRPFLRSAYTSQWCPMTNEARALRDKAARALRQRRKPHYDSVVFGEIAATYKRLAFAEEILRGEPTRSATKPAKASRPSSTALQYPPSRSTPPKPQPTPSRTYSPTQSVSEGGEGCCNGRERVPRCYSSPLAQAALPQQPSPGAIVMANCNRTQVQM